MAFVVGLQDDYRLSYLNASRYVSSRDRSQNLCGFCYVSCIDRCEESCRYLPQF